MPGIRLTLLATSSMGHLMTRFFQRGQFTVTWPLIRLVLMLIFTKVISC